MTLLLTKEMSNLVEEILQRLDGKYPDAECELDYKTPFTLLIAVILSAQCTDKRVNEVTKDLFVKYDTPAEFASLKVEQLEKLIYKCGFYHSKAKNIIGAAKKICSDFGGEVPSTMEELLSLPGVGRKTANVVLAEAFKQQTAPVDTHVFRVSHRLGLSDGKTPEEVEKDLLRIIPTEKLIKTHHLLIFHGRYTCKAIKPQCNDCPLIDLCNFYKEK